VATHDPDIARRVEELQARLRVSGAVAQADRLADAVAGGATGTEILSRLTANDVVAQILAEYTDLQLKLADPGVHADQAVAPTPGRRAHNGPPSHGERPPRRAPRRRRACPSPARHLHVR